MPTEDHIEQKLRRVNNFITSMGLASMKAQEIESILERVEPRKPIRGITIREMEPVVPNALSLKRGIN